MSDANNVAAIKGKTPQTVDDVKKWVKMMGERGMYTPSTAGYRVIALERLTSILGPEEPKDPTAVLASLDEIAKRWATKENAKPETMRAYESRARGALKDFIAYQEDPTKFKGRRREDKVGAEKKEPKANPQQIPLPETNETRVKSSGLRAFPLSDEQDFLYELPPKGLSKREVQRIAFHLLSFARDFDPTDPSGSMFAITKNKPDDE